MNSVFVKRSQARAYLQGYWKVAVFAETVCIGAEILLIIAEWVCFYRSNGIPFYPLALLVDLLLISPLKAGRALFYKTLVTNEEPAKPKLIFRYFYNGYTRSVAWRLALWLRRLGLLLLLSIPSAVFLYISGIAGGEQSQTVAMIAFAFSLVFLVFALIGTEILLFRYIPAVYLLSQVTTAKHALRVSKRISKGNAGNWAVLYLDYAGCCFLLLFLFPVLYVLPTFHTARAATANQLFLQISPLIQEQHLQRGKNHGRIRVEF